MDKWERYRAKIIHKGSINVVARLIRLPKTQHLVDSFLVDISYAAVRTFFISFYLSILTSNCWSYPENFFQDTVLCFTVQGLFRDGANVNTDSDEMRFFSRVFLVTPRADGYVLAILLRARESNVWIFVEKSALSTNNCTSVH
jgi:hypothetical protein